MQRGQEPGAGTGRAGSGDRDAPGAGTGTCRRKSAGAGTGAETGQRGREAGGRAPERGQERKRLKEQREASGAEGRRGTSAGSNRKRCRTSPQGLNSGQTMPPSRMLTRNTPPPTSAPSPPRRHPLRTSSRCLLPFRTTPPPTSAPSPPRRHPLRASSCCPPPPLAPYLCQLPLACTTTRPVSAPLRPLLLSSGRAEEAPRRAGHRLPSPKYAQPTHRPNTHKKRAASAAGCRPMERMRRLYSRSSPVSSATGGS